MEATYSDNLQTAYTARSLFRMFAAMMAAVLSESIRPCAGESEVLEVVAICDHLVLLSFR